MQYGSGDPCLWFSHAFWLGRAGLWRASSHLEPAVSCQLREAAQDPAMMQTSHTFIRASYSDLSSTATAPAWTQFTKLFLLGEAKAIKVKCF